MILLKMTFLLICARKILYITALYLTGNNSLDAAVASLTIMATLKGRDLWTHVQTMPHLFSVGGLFYKQVERDLGLVDGKHCTLPTLPGKVRKN